MADIQISRQTVISFPEENIPPITEGIMDGSLLVSEILLSSHIAFGEINCNKFEVDLQYASDLTGKKIYVYQIIDDVQTPIFTGYVQSSRLDDFGAYRKVVAYDLFYTQGSQDAAAWWNIFWQSRQSSTLGEVLRNFLTYFNIPYVDKTLLNDSMSVSKTQEFSSIRVIDMMKLLCEANICNPNVNRTGEIEFVTIYNTTAISVTDNYEWDNSNFEDYNINPIGLVQIYNKDGHIAISIGSGTNCLRIKDNLFFYDKSATDLNTIATRIYNAVSSLTYMPASIKLILSDPRIKVGTIVNSSKGNSLVCEIEMSGPMLIEETIRSVGEEILAEADSFDAVESRVSDVSDRTTSLEGTTTAIQADIQELYGMITGSYILPFGIVLDEVTDLDQGGSANNVLMFRYNLVESNSVTLYARLAYNVHTFTKTVDGVDYFQNAQVTTKYLLDNAVITSDVAELTDGWHTETYTFLINNAPAGTHDIYLSLESRGASLYSMNAVTGFLVVLAEGSTPAPVPGIDVEDLSDWERTTSAFTITTSLDVNSVSLIRDPDQSVYDILYLKIPMVVMNVYDIEFYLYSSTGFTNYDATNNPCCAYITSNRPTQGDSAFQSRYWKSDNWNTQQATDYTKYTSMFGFTAQVDTYIALNFSGMTPNTQADFQIRGLKVTRRNIQISVHELQVGEWVVSYRSGLGDRGGQLTQSADVIALRMFGDNGWMTCAVISDVDLIGKFNDLGDWFRYGKFVLSDSTIVYIAVVWGFMDPGGDDAVYIWDSNQQIIKTMSNSNEIYWSPGSQATPTSELIEPHMTPEFDAWLVNRWGGNNS